MNKYKVVLLEAGEGKSSLLRQFSHKCRWHAYIHYWSRLESKSECAPKTSVILQWDTAGQEAYYSITVTTTLMRLVL